VICVVDSEAITLTELYPTGVLGEMVDNANVHDAYACPDNIDGVMPTIKHCAVVACVATAPGNAYEEIAVTVVGA
jgi:hypothetical protein